MADGMKSFVAAQNIVNFERRQLQIETHLDNKVRPTSGQTLAMRTMLRNLFGEAGFERLCPGIKVGPVDEDVLQVSCRPRIVLLTSSFVTRTILLSPPSTRLVNPSGR